MARTTGTSDFCLYFLAIFLPPLAIFLTRGCGFDFLISLFLSMLGYLPGIIHALYIVSKSKKQKPVSAA